MENTSGSDLWKRLKRTFISQETYQYLWVTDVLKFHEVLYFCKVCFVFKKHYAYAYISMYMHKTLPILGNEKEQYKIKFYKKLSGKFIFLQATKNLKMSYFTHLTGRVLKK